MFDERYLSSKEFETISDFVITKKELCSKIVIIKQHGKVIMGYPIAIENNKYQRNSLFFTFGFVFEQEGDISPYKHALRKLALDVQGLEIASEFLFNEKTKARNNFSEVFVLLSCA